MADVEREKRCFALELDYERRFAADCDAGIKHSAFARESVRFAMRDMSEPTLLVLGKLGDCDARADRE